MYDASETRSSQIVGQTVIMLSGINEAGNSKLPGVIETKHALRFRPSSRQDGQQDAGQNPDNCHDDEQFEQSECGLVISGCFHFTTDFRATLDAGSVTLSHLEATHVG